MQSTNKFLDSLFNNLSSIYPKNNGMLNSNLFIIFNAYAQVLSNIDNLSTDTSNNTYLNSANVDVLEDNFGAYVDFPKPPRLNTVTNGGEIYRAILRSIYDAFLNGSTEDSMDVGLSTVLSYLAIDNDTSPVIVENNNVFFNTYDRSIQLSYPATTISGTTALPSDITISPSGYVVVDGYNSTSNTIHFTGLLPSSGLACVITYYRDHTNQVNTNWINLTNTSGTSPLPTDLKTIENTYRNVKFSYWWNNFNRDGNGIQIIDGTLDPSDAGLVWRLPEKYCSYIDPYTNNTTKSTLALYNNDGQVYDINSPNKYVNPDYLQSTTILSYVDEVSRDPKDFYMRYNQNNTINTALAQTSGSMNQVEKISDVSVDFGSSDFGLIDFFEKTPNFDLNDIFGFGTKNVWLGVKNVNDQYSLSNKNYFDRTYSLHEKILFKEFFENGIRSLQRFVTVSGSNKIAETVGTPLESSEDCLQLYGSGASVYPNVSSTIISETNRVTVDMFDQHSSGTNSNITISLTDANNSIPSQEVKFRFGIDELPTVGSSVGLYGNVIEDTIPQGHFVDTYFRNYDEIDYSINLSKPYILVSGNTYGGSNYHLETPTTNVIYSNLNDLQDTDIMNLSISSSTSFVIRVLGSNLAIPGYAGYYNNGYKLISWNPTNKSFTITSVDLYSVPAPGGSTPFVVRGNGSGGVAYTFSGAVPDIFDFIINKTNTTVNGIPLNFNLNYNNLGVVPPGPFAVGFIYNSPKAIQINLGIGAKLYHYSLGNSTLMNNFNILYGPNYYYQIATSGSDIEHVAKNTLPFSNQFGWHRVSIDLGSGLNHLTGYLDDYKFCEIALPYSGSFGYAGNINHPSGITINHSSIYPDREYSYFDNIKLSNYNATQVNSIYNYHEDAIQDWQGAFLDQGTVLANRVFKGTRQSNYTFELIIKGLENKFSYVIQSLVSKLKPAHTLVDINVQIDHVLNTTSLVAQYVGDERNWELGNTMNSVVITDGIDGNDPIDLPGLITLNP